MPLVYPRILVVEDEGMIATALCDDLAALGFEPIGPYSSLAASVDAAQGHEFALALIDINLKGEMSFPLVEMLIASGKSVGIMTAYSDTAIPQHFHGLPRLEKPYSNTTLREALFNLMAVYHQRRG